MPFYLLHVQLYRRGPKLIIILNNALQLFYMALLEAGNMCYAIT